VIAVMKLDVRQVHPLFASLQGLRSVGCLIIQCAARAGLLADTFHTESPSSSITFPSVCGLRVPDYADVSNSYSDFMFPSGLSENQNRWIA